MSGGCRRNPRPQKQTRRWSPANDHEDGLSSLGFGCEIVADAADGVTLVLVQREEFESVAQTLAIADDGADFDGIRRERQRNFEGDDFSRFEAAGQSGTNTVLTHLSRASPAAAKFPRLKHFHLQANVNREARKTASVRYFAPAGARTGDRGGLLIRGSGSGFFVVTHAKLPSVIRPG